MVIKRWVLFSLILMTFVGSELRLSHLEKQSLWEDELITLSIAAHPWTTNGDVPLFERKQIFHIADGDSFLTAKAAEQSPPLNDLLEKITVNFFGTTELGARLPAAISACVLLLWFAWFAWRHPDEKVRRNLAWTLLLLALYPILLTYAKEGRAYSLGTTLVGMGGLLWVLRWRNGVVQWRPPGWTEIILFTLACYTHYNAAILVALLLSPDAIVATQRRSKVAWLRLVGLGGMFSVWLALNAHTILFTAEGSVGWDNTNGWGRVWQSLSFSNIALHGQFLALAFVAGLILIYNRKRLQDLGTARQLLVQMLALTALTLAYLTLASLVVWRAGMAHPRYYIFVVPLVAIGLGRVFSEVRSRWLSAMLVCGVFFVAWPTLMGIDDMPKADFRSMSKDAVKHFDANTRFLFPWEPNRPMYRIYLEGLLGQDPTPLMVGISEESQISRKCAELSAFKHIAVIGHESGRKLTDALYAQCGSNWPNREVSNFFITYSEHWRIP